MEPPLAVIEPAPLHLMQTARGRGSSNRGGNKVDVRKDFPQRERDAQWRQFKTRIKTSGFVQKPRPSGWRVNCSIRGSF